MDKALVKRAELAGIIGRHLDDVDCLGGGLSRMLTENEILGEGDRWFVDPKLQSRELEGVVERILGKYELMD